ncbi:class I SAM-dependent methyltransferase [Micromonospora sp. NBC_00362]|uniref:class I SAM-dependent methyltransferase n=1 Tax=Micromonospora sp. NBC_00362 TaxID=2975975 RepID=UPI0022565722|nr:class I SAM-dependent methyltransferase [Micromonospora sp. NBC_00362]MCX5121755.1 class I SAM-dependent methyltransferase [Micromonospora sp. NBC_00362]
MTSSDLWDDNTAERYDALSAEMFEPGCLTLPSISSPGRQGSGPALEFAIGTGRVAIPLAARGIPVTGVGLSQPMVDQLRAKVPAEELPVITSPLWRW